MKKSFRTFFLCSTFVLCPMILSSCQNAGNIIQNKDRNITSIAIKEGSIPEEVFINQFDEAGIKLIVSYSDNTTEEIPVTTDFIPEQYAEYLTKPGTYQITLLYRGMTTTLRIKMVVAHYLVNFYAYKDKNEYELVSAQDIQINNDAETPYYYQNVYYEGYHYTFKNWDKEYTNITAPLDVYAQYDSIEYYVVNFYNGNNDLIDSQYIDKGSDAREPGPYERNMPGYTFMGWDRSYLNVTENIDVYGLYSSLYEVKTVTITNKEQLQNEWHGEDKVELLVDLEDATYAEAYEAGEITAESSNANIVSVSVTSSGIFLNPYGNGIATITVTYKTINTDSVELNADFYGPLRIAQSIDTSKTDYYLRFIYNGKQLFATDQMSGFYISPDSINKRKPVKVLEDEDAVGEYKYTITIGEKMIGAYSGTHKNIGFVGDQVLDNDYHDLTKALFKFTEDHKLATNFFGDVDYYLAAYNGSNYGRIAFQVPNESFREESFLKLVEEGEPEPVYSIVLSQSEVVLHEGRNTRITAKVYPEDTIEQVIWTSDNEEIATVSNGYITGVKQSNTHVTITVSCGECTATCRVVVIEPFGPGSLEKPLNTGEFHVYLDECFPDGSFTTEQVYVTGVVSKISGSTIYLYDLGESIVEYVQVFRATNNTGETIEVGDTIIAHGYAKIYNESIYELYDYYGYTTIDQVIKANNN